MLEQKHINIMSLHGRPRGNILLWKNLRRERKRRWTQQPPPSMLQPPPYPRREDAAVPDPRLEKFQIAKPVKGKNKKLNTPENPRPQVKAFQPVLPPCARPRSRLRSCPLLHPHSNPPPPMLPPVIQPPPHPRSSFFFFCIKNMRWKKEN